VFHTQFQDTYDKEKLTKSLERIGKNIHNITINSFLIDLVIGKPYSKAMENLQEWLCGSFRDSARSSLENIGPVVEQSDSLILVIYRLN